MCRNEKMRKFRYDVEISPVPGPRATHRGPANVVFREFLCIERVLIVFIDSSGGGQLVRGAV